MARETPGRNFGFGNISSGLNDIFMNEAIGGTSPRQSHRSVRRRIEMPANPFEDEPEENNDMAEVLKEMREFKGILNDVKARQIEMEKTLLKINKKLNSTDFDLSKSAHAANVTKICAKAYIQLGRFTKTNDSKTDQLRQEFTNSPYGLTVDDLLAKAEAFEKAKFTYWRAEERRRILAIGTWSSLSTCSTRELADKICGLLGVKYTAVLENTVRQQTALVKSYIAAVGLQNCKKDTNFWLNFYKWSEKKFGPRGPSQIDWDIILAEKE